MSEADQRAARLAALRGSDGNTKVKRRWLAPLLTGGLGLLAGGYLVFVATQIPPASQERLATSSPEEFQLTNIGPQDFASLETANDAFDPEFENLSLLVDELQARIKELTDNPVTIIEQDQVAIEAFDALQLKMESLRLASLERETAFKQLLVESQTLSAQVEQLENALVGSAQDSTAQNNAEDLARQRAARDQQRLDELERQALQEQAQQRAEADTRLTAQINSPMVALRNSTSSNATVAEAGRRYSGDDAFVRAGGTAVSTTRASIIANPSHTIIQGTRIEAVLENAVSSDLAGNIAAIVSYDVYSMDMRRVLIPRGSKLFGRYRPNVALGQKRLLVAWDRLVTTDQQSLILNAYGGDRLGRSGMSGQLDTHFATRFGSAALISVIGLTPALLARTSGSEISAEVLEQVGQDFSGAMGDVMAQYLQMKPTINLDQGSIVTVIVNGDLELF